MRVPTGLSSKSRKIWRTIDATFSLEPHHMCLLEAALQHYDRYLQARKEVDSDGMTIILANGYLQKHPLLSVMNDAYREFRLTWKAIGFSEEVPQDKKEVSWVEKSA